MRQETERPPDGERGQVSPYGSIQGICFLGTTPEEATTPAVRVYGRVEVGNLSAEAAMPSEL